MQSIADDRSFPLYRGSVPAPERAGHLRKLAAAAFEERTAERAKLRAILRSDQEDVYDIYPLAVAQEKSRIWRRIRARAVGHPELQHQAAGSVFEPDDASLILECVHFRAELRNTGDYGTEDEEIEAANFFLISTEFLDRPE
ncbi:hypothetical protein AB0F20_10335 [Streptomyces goshikiensis]|uniref:hypothetical protein n=1 Tax=Streptomyces goshikiensis TaxID=1942 RepID=UPI0034115B54